MVFYRDLWGGQKFEWIPTRTFNLRSSKDYDLYFHISFNCISKIWKFWRQSLNETIKRCDTALKGGYSHRYLERAWVSVRWRTLISFYRWYLHRTSNKTYDENLSKISISLMSFFFKKIPSFQIFLIPIKVNDQTGFSL